MSGGSLDYFYHQVEDVADRFPASTPLRKAFRAHLFDVAQALHDIEWVDSGDYGKGDEDRAIRAALAQSGEAELRVLVAEARALRDALDRALATESPEGGAKE